MIWNVGKTEGQPAHTREAKLGCVFTQTGWDEEGYPIPGNAIKKGSGSVLRLLIGLAAIDIRIAGHQVCERMDRISSFGGGRTDVALPPDPSHAGASTMFLSLRRPRRA
jgi:hypothetical protein